MAEQTRYAALLRAVNVGRATRITMRELIEQFEALGLSEIRTYVQSGNVVFTAGQPANLLVDRIESQLRTRFDMNIAVLLRSCLELRNIVENNPFLSDGKDPADLHVTFLSRIPEVDAAIKTGHGESADAYVLIGDTVYICCPNGYGRTKLTNGFFEKRLDAVATTRSWKTVQAVLELCEVG